MHEDEIQARREARRFVLHLAAVITAVASAILLVAGIGWSLIAPGIEAEAIRTRAAAIRDAKQVAGEEWIYALQPEDR